MLAQSVRKFAFIFLECVCVYIFGSVCDSCCNNVTIIIDSEIYSEFQRIRKSISNVNKYSLYHWLNAIYTKHPHISIKAKIKWKIFALGIWQKKKKKYFIGFWCALHTKMPVGFIFIWCQQADTAHSKVAKFHFVGALTLNTYL